jgi:hypothetical protein
VIYGQCNKSRHSKECCHWNPNNPNNKLKDKKEVAVNGVLAQFGGTGNKSSSKRGQGKGNKSTSIIYCCFICNSIEHQIYDYLHKDATQAMFKEKVAVATFKKDDVVVNMVLAVSIRS